MPIWAIYMLLTVLKNMLSPIIRKHTGMLNY